MRKYVKGEEKRWKVRRKGNVFNVGGFGYEEIVDFEVEHHPEKNAIEFRLYSSGDVAMFFVIDYQRAANLGSVLEQIRLDAVELKRPTKDDRS